MSSPYTRQPFVEPRTKRHTAVLGEIHTLEAFSIRIELEGQFLLRTRKYSLINRQTVFFVSYDDSAFPSTVGRTFSDHSVTRRSAFCHSLVFLLSSGILHHRIRGVTVFVWI